MHAYQQTTASEFLFIILIDIITWNLVDLVYDQFPTTQIEVTHTKVHTLDTYVGDNILKTLHEFSFDVIVNSSHCLIVFEQSDYIFRFVYRYKQETSGHKRSAFITLLSYRGVLAYLYYKDISHARAIAQASADLFM